MSRPPFLRRRHLLGALSLAPLVSLPVAARAAPRLQWRQPLMGTWVDIQVAAGSADAQAVARRLKAARQAFIDVPYVPLGQFYQPTAYRDDLSGMLKGLPLFWNIRRA